MPKFAPGDRVHVPMLGTGIVREVRNGRRYVVEVKGRPVVLAEARLEAAPEQRRGRPPGLVAEVAGASEVAPHTMSLDLHGLTAPEAVEALEAFLNQALLAGASEARIIHGRSGGRLKAAVHARLKEWPGLAAFGLDSGNPGVTIVRF